MTATIRQRPIGANPIYWASFRDTFPHDWIVTVVGQMATTIKGKLPSVILDKPTEHSKPYLLMEGLRGGAHLFTEEINLPSVTETDIIMIADGSKSGYTVRGSSGVLGSTLLMLHAHNEFNPSYLFHLLSSLFPFLNSTTTGTAVPHLDQDLLLSLPLGIPANPAEQETIARILDVVDTAITSAREVVQRARLLQTSLIADSFDCHKGAQKKLAEYITDIRYGTSQAADEKGWGNPTLRIPNVVADEISYDDLVYVNVKPADVARLKLKDGDLLLVRTNGNPNYVGRSAVFKEPDDRTWLFASYLIRVRLNGRLNPDYVNIFLGTERGRRELLRRVTTSAGNHNINANSIRLIKIPIPESIDNQDEIIEIARKSRTYIDSLRKKLIALEKLKKSLMHDLLTGKVRVNHAIDKILSSEAS